MSFAAIFLPANLRRIASSTLRLAMKTLLTRTDISTVMKAIRSGDSLMISLLPAAPIEIQFPANCSSTPRSPPDPEKCICQVCSCVRSHSLPVRPKLFISHTSEVNKFTGVFNSARLPPSRSPPEPKKMCLIARQALPSGAHCVHSECHEHMLHIQ
jgi:hypothetical protein